MIVTIEESVELDLLPGWRELPPARVMATDDWMWEWVECSEVECDRREPFTEALGRVSRFVRSVDDSERLWMIVSDPTFPPERLGVAAVSLVTDPEAAEPGFVGTAPVFSSQRRTAQIPGGQIVSVHELVVTTDEDGTPWVAERYVGWWRRPGQALTVRLELFSQSVDTFRDLLALGEAALLGTRIV